MAEIVVENSYKGVHLELPITKQAFHDLVNSFKLNQVRELNLFKAYSAQIYSVCAYF